GFGGAASATPAGRPSSLSCTASLNTACRATLPFSATVCPGVSVNVVSLNCTSNGRRTTTGTAALVTVRSAGPTLPLPWITRSTAPSGPFAGTVTVHVALSPAAGCDGWKTSGAGGGGWPGVGAETGPTPTTWTATAA